MKAKGSLNSKTRRIMEMGEAKRRKEAGLAPKTTKKESKSKSKSLNLLVKYPRLPLYLGILFGSYLIFDVIKYYR